LEMVSVCEGIIANGTSGRGSKKCDDQIDTAARVASALASRGKQ